MDDAWWYPPPKKVTEWWGAKRLSAQHFVLEKIFEPKPSHLLPLGPDAPSRPAKNTPTGMKVPKGAERRFHLLTKLCSQIILVSVSLIYLKKIEV